MLGEIKLYRPIFDYYRLLPAAGEYYLRVVTRHAVGMSVGLSVRPIK